MFRCLFRRGISAFVGLVLALQVVFCCPVSSKAATLPNNPPGSTVEEIRESDAMIENQGTVNKNSGTIDFNASTGLVKDNSGQVINNKGTVKENRSDVSFNQGSSDEKPAVIEFNYGTLSSNKEYGVVNKNESQAKILNNENLVKVNEGKVVINGVTGTVEDNLGTVTQNSGNVLRVGDGETKTGLVNSNEKNGIIGTVNSNGSVSNNKGEIYKNNGEVDFNSGTGFIKDNFNYVEHNEAKVEYNAKNGVINSNRGPVTSNYGTINYNSSPEVVNMGSGTIKINNANLEKNLGCIEKHYEGKTLGENVQALDGGMPVEGSGVVKNNSGIIVKNSGTIEKNEESGSVGTNGKNHTVEENYGSVDKNYGEVKGNKSAASKVQDNYGTVGENIGTVGINHAGGSVSNNQNSIGINEAEATIITNSVYGTVNSNIGTVADNKGTVKTNESGGLVEENSQKVVLNASEATVKKNSGIIETNSGEVTESNEGRIYLNNGDVASNSGIIDDNAASAKDMVNEASGSVFANHALIRNYGSVKTNEADGEVYDYGGTVDENNGLHYHDVQLQMSASSKHVKAGGATGFNSYDGIETWLEESGTGSVIVKPNSGYKIDSVSGGSMITAVKNPDGTWTVSVSGITSNMVVPYDVLASMMKKTKNKTASNASSCAFCEECKKLIQNAEPDSALVLNMAGANQVLLHRAVFEAWEKRPDIGICFIYRMNQQLYLLAVPAGTDLSAIPGGNRSVSILKAAEVLGLDPIPVTEEELQTIDLESLLDAA